MNLKQLYENRFSKDEVATKALIWKVLYKNFFNKYIGPADNILDIGAGYCDFINNTPLCGCQLSKGRRIAVDLNPDVYKYASPGVEVFVSRAQKMEFLSDSSIDIVFISNFFEHIHQKEEILEILDEVKRVLKKDGKLLVLQPNIKYAYKEYWDFFDHCIPLTDKSMVEALNIVSGFKIIRLLPQFLPYTTKSRIPQWPCLIKLYLYFPLAWKMMGKQMFLAAQKL